MTPVTEPLVLEEGFPTKSAYVFPRVLSVPPVPNDESQGLERYCWTVGRGSRKEKGSSLGGSLVFEPVGGRRRSGRRTFFGRGTLVGGHCKGPRPTKRSGVTVVGGDRVRERIDQKEREDRGRTVEVTPTDFLESFSV